MSYAAADRPAATAEMMRSQVGRCFRRLADRRLRVPFRRLILLEDPKRADTTAAKVHSSNISITRGVNPA